MIRHNYVDDVFCAALWHVASDAAGRNRMFAACDECLESRGVALETHLRVLAFRAFSARGAMRIMAGFARQLTLTLQKTARLP
jgi:hypothetical protein